MRITAFAVLLLALGRPGRPWWSRGPPPLNRAWPRAKPVAAGAWGYLYGQGSTAFSQQYFSDGDLVYDTSLQVYLLNGEPYSIPIEITSEQFVWGSETVYENVTRGNSTVLEPVTVPVRVDVQWSNVSVTMLASTLTSATSLAGDLVSEGPRRHHWRSLLAAEPPHSRHELPLGPLDDWERLLRSRRRVAPLRPTS